MANPTQSLLAIPLLRAVVVEVGASVLKAILLVEEEVQARYGIQLRLLALAV
jgi:hypothetical protein